MTTLPERLNSNIREHALLRDGSRVLVAVSGGVDSMVLLRVLADLAPARKWKLSVAHFNHLLRGKQSDADELLVKRTAKKLKLPFAAGRADVRQFAGEHGLSVEMAARKLRHDFLAATAVKQKIPTIALAHHADDQVELFFLRLLRGAGSDGLAGMKRSNPTPSNPKIQLVRPLLDFTKAELLEYALAQKIEFSEDASNASTDFQRNRIRHKLIPALTREYQPALARVILRAMDVISADAEIASSAAGEWLRNPARKSFDTLPVAVQRRVIHQQCVEKSIAPDFEMVERLRLNPGQWMAVSEEGEVCRSPEGAIEWRGPRDFSFQSERQEFAPGPKWKELAFSGLKVLCQVADRKGTGKAHPGWKVEYFDADKVGLPIWLRRWQPGDRFQPIGMSSAGKLQDMFVNLKVPRAERHQRVVAATSTGEIFWVEGLRMAERFKLDHQTVRTLIWCWQKKASPA